MARPTDAAVDEFIDRCNADGFMGLRPRDVRIELIKPEVCRGAIWARWQIYRWEQDQHDRMYRW